MPFLRTITLAAAVAAASPALAEPASGSYLAARSAMIANDYDEAARQFSRALVRDSRNPVLIESALTAYIGLGDLERAAPLARRLTELGVTSQLASLALAGDAAVRGNWDELLADLEAGMTIGPLFDGLLNAWAELGAGRMSEALAGFDAVTGNSGVEAFGLYHKALALASVGDFEGAATILGGEGGSTIRLTTRGVIAYAQVLSQLERSDEALELLDASFGSTSNPQLVAMNETLEAGETLPFDTVRTAADGVAEIYHSIGGALRGEAQDAYTLLYTRMALAVRPDHLDALLATAEILEGLEQYDLATEVYDMVPEASPFYHSAEMGRAAALRRSGQSDAAIEVLQQLSESHGELPSVQIALGDAFRQVENFEASLTPYGRALELIETPQEQHWIVYFARGISHERLDLWDDAEADFRAALELRPEQPQVLNYLGYSFLEMNENLGEALDLIERAVEQRPDSGYIVDSLGWGLYRLGRYEEAVEHMERAVELLPVDPIVNDHLGDVYWAVGRAREAEFQWHRALSFITEDTDPNDVDAERVRRKLEVGLDVVLDEEGAPPLKVANEDG
ncbi:MAG: tetratricopeptide repeat protein [Boseongicola sp.]|nr:tetratricopeptide repeat protein [Boseongicola sp.]